MVSVTDISCVSFCICSYMLYTLNPYERVSEQLPTTNHQSDLVRNPCKALSPRLQLSSHPLPSPTWPATMTSANHPRSTRALWQLPEAKLISSTGIYFMSFSSFKASSYLEYNPIAIHSTETANNLKPTCLWLDQTKPSGHPRAWLPTQPTGKKSDICSCLRKFTSSIPSS